MRSACDLRSTSSRGHSQSREVANTCIPGRKAAIWQQKAYEQQILSRLQQERIGFVALAGYMRLIGPTLLSEYYGKIINLHPSLLPAFPGLDAVGQALEAGVKVTGVTVHFVDAGMDTGPVIAQQAVAIDDDDDHESLSQKIHALEHQLYPRIIHQCALGEIYLDQGKVCRLVR